MNRLQRGVMAWANRMVDPTPLVVRWWRWIREWGPTGS